MKNHLAFLVLIALLSACNSSNKTTEDTNSLTATAAVDSAISAKPQNCRSIVETGKLDKTDEYQESAKPVKTTLTLRQDENSMTIANGCIFHNKVEVVATRKSGKQEFKRTLLKDDLLLFTKNDEPIEASILKSATYVPSFNSQKYVTVKMSLTDPQTQKNTDYTVFLNYYGEIIKVK